MNLPTRAGLLLLWLLHFLPNKALTALGRGVGGLLWLIMSERRHIALTNLALCFPEKPEAERTALAREHFALYGQTMFERTILWWGSEARIRRFLRTEGLENFDAPGQRPILLFSIHFVGMDVGWLGISLNRRASGSYASVKNPVMEHHIRSKRTRFGDTLAFSSKDGLKGPIKAMRQGYPLMYLPDMDFGRKHSLFVPFFGNVAATIPNLSRMAAAAGAVVVPVITRLTPQGWVVSIEPAWQDFPSADLMADTRRMNAYIERCVREYPAQYWWTHKRFKTRPDGEKSVY